MNGKNIVLFKSNHINCVASKLDNGHYMLSMRSCVINFDSKPAVNVDYLPTGITRVTINNGQVWFDVENSDDAAKIEALFGK